MLDQHRVKWKDVGDLDKNDEEYNSQGQQVSNRNAEGINMTKMDPCLTKAGMDGNDNTLHKIEHGQA